MARADDFQVGQYAGQFRMGLLLLLEVGQRFVPEIHVLFDPPANVLHEDHDVVEDPLDFGPPSLLLLGRVDGPQGVAGGAGGAALHGGPLPFDVEDILARPDAQRGPHDVHHGELAERRVLDALDGVDHGRAFEAVGSGQRLEMSAAGLVQPAGITKTAQHRGPAFAIGGQRAGRAEPAVLEELAAFHLRSHFPTGGQTAAESPVDAPLGGERRRPVQREDLARVLLGHVALVPDPGGLEDRHPDLAALAVGHPARADEPFRPFSAERSIRASSPRLAATAMTIACRSGSRCRRKFSLGISAEAMGISAASITMSSAKKSGRTRKRQGASTLSPAAPSRGSVLTKVCPIASS